MPFDHPPELKPRTAVFWRSAAAVTDFLSAPPEPAVVQLDGYVPQPCLLGPEQVTEYPDSMELSEELRERLGDWSTWQAASAAPDSSYAPAPEEFYRNELSVAPGWKVGGWTRWGLTDPVPRVCPACDADMDPLLTIASTEWDDSTRSWVPYEDQADATPSTADPDPANPAMVEIAGGYDPQLYACPASLDHPHTDLIQWGLPNLDHFQLPLRTRAARTMSPTRQGLSLIRFSAGKRSMSSPAARTPSAPYASASGPTHGGGSRRLGLEGIEPRHRPRQRVRAAHRERARGGAYTDNAPTSDVPQNVRDEYAARDGRAARMAVAEASAG